MKSMTATQGTNAWKRLGGELLAAIHRDFERALLIPARAIWPALIQPRGLAAYDRAGADLVAFGEDGGLEAVIQCKGFFKAEGLQGDQFSSFQKSIAGFEKSGLTTDTFAVVHNQDGRNVKVAAKIDQALARLLAAGKAKKVVQWDRNGFLKTVENRLREMVFDRVGEQSKLMLEQLDRQFAYGNTYIPDVPVTRRSLRLRRGHPPQIRKSRRERERTNIAEALTRASGRWTLLTGLFGTGKTSAALHAARLSPQRLVYVHAGSIEPKQGEGGTNSLMARIVESLSIFGDFEADERGLFERLAGPMLRQLLQAPDTDALLILDALDENRTLGSPEAVTRFASALSELSCPLIMTTREEHFRATFGNFDHLFDELSTKGGNTRDVTLLELEPWSNEEALALVEAAAEEVPGNSGLRTLRDRLQSGEDAGWGEEFLHHPFFLRMIIDLTADGAEAGGSRAEIIGAWIWAKLTRDLKAARSTPVPVRDRNRCVEQMEAFMTALAGEMVVRGGDGYRLLDAIGSDAVIATCERVLNVHGLDLGQAIAVSLLIPTTVRHRGEVPVRFTHRAFQEYFLARHLAQGGEASANYPAGVRIFCHDLAAAALP